jgi:hypothetical protein
VLSIALGYKRFKAFQSNVGAVIGQGYVVNKMGVQ